MKVREIMRSPVTVTENTTLKEVVDLFNDHTLSGFPVVDSQGNLKGIITEHDIIKAVLPTYEDLLSTDASLLDTSLMENRAYSVRDKPVSSIMSHGVVSIAPDDTLLKAASTMILKKVKVLPALEDGKPVGVISRLDVVQAVMHLSSK